jgi:hypothetical protein
LGLPSPPPFPQPLLPFSSDFPPDCAMAVEVSEVDNKSVIAGGVTTANLPQAAKNFRLSSIEADSRSLGFDICLSLGAAEK